MAKQEPKPPKGNLGVRIDASTEAGLDRWLAKLNKGRAPAFQITKSTLVQATLAWAVRNEPDVERA